jgi:hypothetical protein
MGIMEQKLLQLLKDNYFASIQNDVDNCIELIRKTDIMSRLEQSLKNGYAGFTLMAGPYVSTYSNEQRRAIQTEVIKQGVAAGLKERNLLISVRNGVVQIYFCCDEMRNLIGDLPIIPEPLN